LSERCRNRWSLEWRPLWLALSGYGFFGVGLFRLLDLHRCAIPQRGLECCDGEQFLHSSRCGDRVIGPVVVGLLARMRGRQALATLNALLALATLIPALMMHRLAAFASIAIFGRDVPLSGRIDDSVVRHNLPPSHWTTRSSSFTIVFAFKQIVGPVIMGWGASPSNGYSAIRAQCRRSTHEQGFQNPECEHRFTDVGKMGRQPA